MSMQDLEKAFELIERHFLEEDKTYSGPKSLETIKKVERYLDVNFSNTYKSFIKKFGFGGVGSALVYGIVTEDGEEIYKTGIAWGAKQDRKNFSFPHHLIAIYNVGEGTTYCLDTSQMNESGECPVVAWPLGGYEETPVLEIVSEDFGKFFLDRVEEQIALKTEQTR